MAVNQFGAPAARQSMLGQFGLPENVRGIPKEPEQLDALRSLLQMGQQNLTDPGRGFEGIARGAQQRFEQETLPSLLQRFAGTGADISSPSLKGELGQAGASLQERLAQLEGQYRQQAQQLGTQQVEAGLQPFQDLVEQKPDPGFLKTATSGVGQAIGAALPFILAAYGGGGVAEGASALASLYPLLQQLMSGDQQPQQQTSGPSLAAINQQAMKDISPMGQINQILQGR